MSQLSVLTQLQRARDNSEDPLYWRSHEPQAEAVIPGEPSDQKTDTLLGETRNVTVSAWGRPGKAAISLTLKDKCDHLIVEVDGEALELMNKLAKEVGIL